MIPKKIHYCWFGRGPKPKLVEKCIASWRKFCPDYEIIEWNEDNFDVNLNGYTRMCYEEKKYAFLSDFVRLAVVAEHGGIYFDTDVEMIRPISLPDSCGAFFGFETEEFVNTGIGFGSVSHGIVIEAMLAEYDILLDGTQGTRGCPILNTRALLKLGLKQDGSRQQVADALILPADYLNPFDAVTGRLRKTRNTMSIHWYSGSWMSPVMIWKNRLGRIIRRIFGDDCLRFLQQNQVDKGR